VITYHVKHCRYGPWVPAFQKFPQFPSVSGGNFMADNFSRPDLFTLINNATAVCLLCETQKIGSWQLPWQMQPASTPLTLSVTPRWALVCRNLDV